MRDGNLEDFFQQENQAWPPALSDGGRLRLGTKNDILTCLGDLSPSQTKTHDATCIVLDGAAIKQTMKPAAAKTFDEYAQHVIIPYSSSQLRSVSRVDLVWDIYKDDSLKDTARAKRGKGDMWLGRLPYPETGRTFYGSTAIRENYSVSCPRSGVL